MPAGLKDSGCVRCANQEGRRLELSGSTKFLSSVSVQLIDHINYTRAGKLRM
jgi:hypothetical protein